MSRGAEGESGMGHEECSTWDAAYVLGSLSATERRRFEEHLADCPACQDAVRELAPMPGLLAHLTPEQGAALLDAGPETDAEVAARSVDRSGADLVRAARRRTRARWTRRIVVAAAGVAAAAALVLVVVLPRTGQDEPPDVQVALSAHAPAPVTARMGLTEVPWGTRLDMECTYPQSAPGGPGPWTYALVVVSDSGATSQVSTWEGHRGTEARMSAATALPLKDIRRVEVRSVKTGKVLLSATPT